MATDMAISQIRYRKARKHDQVHYVDEICQTNLERARRVEQFIRSYTPADPFDVESTLVDMLTDMIHFCRMNGISFVGVLRRAEYHHRAERHAES